MKDRLPTPFETKVLKRINRPESYRLLAGNGMGANSATEQTRCHADIDGDCEWSGCPQLRDGEPDKSHRSCPLANWGDDEC